MQRRGKLLLVTLLLGTLTVWAQERYHSVDPDLLARLSYQRSLLSDQGFQHTCIAISRTGTFRMVSWTDRKIGFEGKLATNQLDQLKKLLAARGLQSSLENEIGIIRDHSESFMAEISRIEITPKFQLQSTIPSGLPRSAPATPRRVQWLNADDLNPFPVPMARVIDWMRTFELGQAKPVDDLEFSEVCPSVGLSFVQPSVATNKHP